MAEQEPRTPVDPMAKARRESDLLLWVVVGIAVLIACLWLYGAFGVEHEKPEQVVPPATGGFVVRCHYAIACVRRTFAEGTKAVERKRYFILKRGRQCGPYTKAELRTKDLMADTPVWDEDLYTWSAAEKFNDLKDLLQVPPGAMPVLPKKRRGWLSLGRRRRT